MTDSWFGDVPVIGALPPEAMAAKLRELGQDELAELALEVPPTQSFGAGWRPFGRAPQAWQHTAHTFGFVAAGAATGDPIPVRHAGVIAADETLRNARIRITLDRLRVADYPGRGLHRVLFDFYAQNQVAGRIEHLHFNATLRAQEGEGAGTIGYPIFSGLHVGSDGVAFKCFTVNVQNDDDEAFLGFLESDVFKAGLQLASIGQPALAPLSEMALGMTKAIARRNRNVAVQDFFLGLDFSDIPLRARLATGSYIAVQIPETLAAIWDWNDWVYVPSTGQLSSREDHSVLIPHNYVVVSVSAYSGS
jgi:hypothetical protein